jgi:hypothetical protein
MKTFDQIVSETIRKHSAKTSMEEMADNLGIATSYLYRVANPFDESAPLPSKHLINLMTHTKDYSILKHLAQRCGFICVKMPRVRSAKESEIGLYQRRQAEAIRAVVAFFQKSASMDETLEAIRKELEAAAGFMKAIEEQPGLFEEEGEEG